MEKNKFVIWTVVVGVGMVVGGGGKECGVYLHECFLCAYHLCRYIYVCV